MNAKEKLIDASLELMLTKGYGATSVDDLCQSAGVSKGSFYHFFGTKEDLGLALLDDYLSKSKIYFLGGPFTEEQDPIKKLFGFLRQTEASAEILWKDGCLLGNFAIELGLSHPAVRQKVSVIFTRITKGVADLFQPVSALHPDNAMLEADRLAEAYLAIIEGAIILSRAHDDWSYLHRSLVNFRVYIESVID